MTFRSLLAGISLGSVFMTNIAAAAYSDVHDGAWYARAVEAFAEDGYIDVSQQLFRPADNATRAEFIKLIVELNGGILQTAPAVPSFDDVSKDQWFYAYMEEAGRESWVKGDGNCYGTHSCMAHPNDSITRGEVAVIAARAFNIDGTGDAPRFIDLDPEAWYRDSIQALSDHCFIRGDDATGKVRPLDPINRAEMIHILYQIDQMQTNGTSCDWLPPIRRVTQTDFGIVEVEFWDDIDPQAMLDVSRYAIDETQDLIVIKSALRIDEHTVELTMEEPFGSCGDEHVLVVNGMKNADGSTFSTVAQFETFCD